VTPLSRAELLELPPVITIRTLGQALGLSEPTVRDRVRGGEIEALGITTVKLGQQWRVITEDVLRWLGVTRDMEVAARPAGHSPRGPSPHVDEAGLTTPGPSSPRTHSAPLQSRQC
jgi:Helix-turn-helix domain